MDVVPCIYCAITAKFRFRPEHVMPKGLGRFRRNLTIFCVCNECNDSFGKTLERVVERDSLLGLLRLHHGLKPVQEASQVAGKRLVTNLADGKVLKGAPMRLVNSKDVLRMVHEEAVGFELANGDIAWHDPNTLTAEIVARYKPWVRTRIICHEGHGDDLMTRLKALGMSITDEAFSPIKHDGPLNVHSSSMFDDFEFRLFAKIALNYVAWNSSATTVLGGAFNTIRRYVRYGGAPSVPVSKPLHPELLGGDHQEWRASHGHLLTMSLSTRWSLIVEVGLFNTVSFRVTVCDRFPGLWFPEVRHLFDLDRKGVVKLAPSGRRPLL